MEVTATSASAFVPTEFEKSDSTSETDIISEDSLSFASELLLPTSVLESDSSLLPLGGAIWESSGSNESQSSSSSRSLSAS